MKYLILFFTAFFLPSNCFAAEITEAYGYTFGEALAEADIITKGEGIGPHVVAAKKKARTVQSVQVYTTLSQQLIFSIEGLISFRTIDDCTRMGTTISFFLQKKYADVIDEAGNIGDSTVEKGTLFSDKDGAKTVSIVCSATSSLTRLSIRYTDLNLAGQALKDWDERIDGLVDSDSSAMSL